MLKAGSSGGKFTYELAGSSEGRRTNVGDGIATQPPMVTCIEVKDDIDQRIRDNGRINIHGTAPQLSVK
jgi:hypothetical protein